MARSWYEQEALWRSLSPAFTGPDAAARAEREADAITSFAGLRPGDAVLDLAAGTGRLSVALARRGLRATAVDLCASFMTALAREAEEQSLPIEVVRRDIRGFERRGAFAAAVSWGDSLGWFEAQGDDRAVLASAYGSLRDGGALIVQLTPKEIAAGAWPARTWEARGADRWLLEEHQIARNFGQVRHTWTALAPEGRQVFQGARRLYAATELVALLNDVGFEEVSCLGDLDRRPFGRDARTLIAVARR